MSTPQQFEQLIGKVLRVGVLVSSACLAVGLVLSFLSSPPSIATPLLQLGIVVLLCTPVARVVVSVLEYIGKRDWLFATLTLIVLAELVASGVAALIFNRKL
jgi:uncharacterized membrane protein